jgi:hypothetical protein
MTGFGRLFADDTCIGHMAHNEENLHTLISTDLEYLNVWSYRWLVKFNPNKTDILYLSFPNMLSCLEVLSIRTSICYLHIQSLLKVTPKCLCICTGGSEILLKSNSTLSSKCLVLKRPILEYASEVWDNCGQAHCNHLEQIQKEAARIVTGLSIYASIYKETGWEALSTRRKVKKLLLFFTKLSIKKHQIMYICIYFAF